MQVSRVPQSLFHEGPSIADNVDSLNKGQNETLPRRSLHSIRRSRNFPQSLFHESPINSDNDDSHTSHKNDLPRRSFHAIRRSRNFPQSLFHESPINAEKADVPGKSQKESSPKRSYRTNRRGQSCRNLSGLQDSIDMCDLPPRQPERQPTKSSLSRFDTSLDMESVIDHQSTKRRQRKQRNTDMTLTNKQQSASGQGISDSTLTTQDSDPLGRSVESKLDQQPSIIQDIVAVNSFGTSKSSVPPNRKSTYHNRDRLSTIRVIHTASAQNDSCISSCTFDASALDYSYEDIGKNEPLTESRFVVCFSEMNGATTRKPIQPTRRSTISTTAEVDFEAERNLR